MLSEFCSTASRQLSKTGIFPPEIRFRWPGRHGLWSTALPNWPLAGVFHSMRRPPSISRATQPGQSSAADQGRTCREASVRSILGHRAQTPDYFCPQAERPQRTTASAPRHVSRSIPLDLTFSDKGLMEILAANTFRLDTELRLPRDYLLQTRAGSCAFDWEADCACQICGRA